MINAKQSNVCQRLARDHENLDRLDYLEYVEYMSALHRAEDMKESDHLRGKLLETRVNMAASSAKLRAAARTHMKLVEQRDKARAHVEKLLMVRKACNMSTKPCILPVRSCDYATVPQEEAKAPCKVITSMGLRIGPPWGEPAVSIRTEDDIRHRAEEQLAIISARVYPAIQPLESPDSPRSPP